MVRGAGEEPAVLGDQIVDELKARENRHGFIVLPKASRLNGGGPQFERGDQVRIKSGPMSGLSGLVEGMRPRERVEVLLELLGGLQRVEIAASAVERVT